MKLFIHYAKKSITVLKNDGLSGLFLKIKSKFKNHVYRREIDPLWINRNEPAAHDLARQKQHAFPSEPVISVIVPTFNTPVRYLTEMIESVLSQSYPHWELCIADGGSSDAELKNVISSYAEKDSRLKVRHLPDNKGISANSNEALSLAHGDFVAFLDHDDTLAPFALFEIASAINSDPEADIIYSDEDKIADDGKIRFQPHFKPDWSPDTLRSYNYINHLTVIRKTLLDHIGYFKEGYEGSQDHDLLLRATEKARNIVHIQKILYHWRSHGSSVAGDPEAKRYAQEAGKVLLQDHLRRLGMEGTVEEGLSIFTYKVSYDVKDKQRISIIIPNKDHAKDLKRCVGSIINKSSYRNYEIIIVENGSAQDRTFDLYEKLKKSNDNINVVSWNDRFNYSAINNFAAAHATGDILLFLNNDTEVIAADWLERMLEHAVRNEVGAVGAKLYYPDGTIQHAGVILGIREVAGHSHKRFDRTEPGYFKRLIVVQNVSAVTGACLMMRKDVFLSVGGFDENYSHAFNDVDLCMKIRQKGYLIIYTPFAELYHHESKSRGLDSDPDKQARFQREIDLFSSKWQAELKKGDPYYNINLTRSREDFSLRTE